MKKAVQYGAGNIGRGFIGQLLSQSGYEVVFIDVNKEVVKKLNLDHYYPIDIISENNPRELTVHNVRAVDGMDMEAISNEIIDAEIMSTAVGVNVLPRIIKHIVFGLKKRWASGNMQPLNIIICENLLNADKYMEGLIKAELCPNEVELFIQSVGLVEASIGRMVPIMTEKMQKGNILRVCVEECCELPVDRDAFKGEIPHINNMVPSSPFEYYIQRKLFIHNMGHALTAYIGNLVNYKFVWEANKDPYIKIICSRAMYESAKALSLEHNISLNIILKHVDDLLYRFGNRGLGDTIERVGKDPIRKLSQSDRMIGGAELCLKHGEKPIYICMGIAAALCFDVKEDNAAAEIQHIIAESSIDGVLTKICGLAKESVLKGIIQEFYSMFKRGESLEVVLSLAEQMKY